MAYDMGDMVKRKIAEIMKHGTLQGKKVSMSDPDQRKRILAAAYSKARAGMGKK